MFLIRLLVIGDTGVGKTSVLLRFYDDSYTNASKSTIGVDYKAKEVDIDGEVVKLQIWDTAGQERFRSMTSAFYGKAQGAIVVFDVSDASSFEHLTQWIKDIQQHAPEGCSIIICANKVDLPPERWAVTREQIAEFGTTVGFPVVETSASSGQNVNESFVELGRRVLTTQRGKLTDIRESVTLYEIPKAPTQDANAAANKKGGCGCS